MNHCFEIEIDQAEGALLRVLGTVERRGFSLLELNAGKPDADSVALRLTLDGERDPEVLCRQLQRLVDVRAIRLVPESIVEPSTPGFHATWLE